LGTDGRSNSPSPVRACASGFPRAPGGKRDLDSSWLSFEFKKSIGFIDDTVLNCNAQESFQHEIPFDKRDIRGFAVKF
jgi:hypothetical protein